MLSDMSPYEYLLEGLETKSDKIRALARHGVPTAEVARILGIRYQHARNVLMAEGLHRPKAETNAAPRDAGFAEMPTAALSPPVSALLPEWLEIAADGSLKLPKPFLAAAGLAPGGSVMVSAGPDGLDLLSQEAALARARNILRRYVPAGVSLADELVADRRREAQQENEDR